ncbi:hypothetical protein [Branchiibius sp. NY16-3462-2]|uniref:hypothetical protein n=1 Tax=Branchiibius sp. NY16-3462-2 TaxID=1807500 RepID=UPI00079A512E|nr:hypothetical protein [Branchiibius sp. NY16-3462-2]KYH43061.1 hypothetical protein AZH51_06325 [Branchiibius sp. NY16-3462-2]
MTDSTVLVPDDVARELTHAVAQHCATRASARILHLKGLALDEPLRRDTISNDVDVLIDPTQTAALAKQLRRCGWVIETDFASGSPFEHAATWHHPVWGYLDVHRWWPGIEIDPTRAFELLWASRQQRPFAGLVGAVPALLDQRIILLLNAARAGDHARAEDLDSSWQDLTHTQQQEIRGRVAQFRAEPAFAVTQGDLEQFRDRPSYRLWRAMSEPTSRTAEWYARVYAARGLRARARLIGQALVVNRQHLEVLAGRPLGRRELAAAQWRRVRETGRELLTATRNAGRRP